MSKLSRGELHEIAEKAADGSIRKKVRAKACLSSLRDMDISIRQLEEQLERMKADAGGVRGMDYAGVRARTSTNGDGMGKNVLRYIEMESGIMQRKAELREKQLKVIEEIQETGKAAYSQLLYKKYVEYKRLELIAAEMNFSYDHTRRMHGLALQEFERVHNGKGEENV